MLSTSFRRFVALSLLYATAILLPAHAQNFSVLYTFTGTPDGANPYQSNFLDINGTLYGTTGSGGAFGFGTIFKLSPTGQETILYNFTGGADGADPSSGLITDGKGNFYGTTFQGGNLSCVIVNPPGCGVVYKLSKAGVFSVLYTFTGGADGAYPQGLVFDRAGNLYGPALYGGAYFGGVIFKLDTNNNETSLYTFTGGADGATPNGFITIDSSGNLYGGAVGGGIIPNCLNNGVQVGCGTIFRVDSSGNETTLYTFAGGADGAFPNSALLADSKGNLFGTAYVGGDLNCINIPTISPGCGVVFEVNASAKTEKVLHTFTGPDGANPTYGLLRDSLGNLFDTTSYGGALNFGAVFELNAKGETVLYSFTDTADGAYPQSGLIRDAIGNLYSNAFYGGNLSCNSPNGCGTVFKIVAPPQITKFSPSAGTPGTVVTINGVALSQTTAVTFNGAQAANFVYNSDTQITATVPVGALSGKIMVTSPGGTFRSTASFTVIK